MPHRNRNGLTLSRGFAFPVAFGHAIYRGGWWTAVFIPALSERSSATFAGGYQLWIADLRQLGSYQCLEMAGVMERLCRLIGLCSGYMDHQRLSPNCCSQKSSRTLIVSTQSVRPGGFTW